jgi:hypothetical protein
MEYPLALRVHGGVPFFAAASAFGRRDGANAD